MIKRKQTTADRLKTAAMVLVFVALIGLWELIKYGGKQQDWSIIISGFVGMVLCLVALPFLIGREDSNVS